MRSLFHKVSTTMVMSLLQSVTIFYQATSKVPPRPWRGGRRGGCPGRCGIMWGGGTAWRVPVTASWQELWQQSHCSYQLSAGGDNPNLKGRRDPGGGASCAFSPYSFSFCHCKVWTVRSGLCRDCLPAPISSQQRIWVGGEQANSICVPVWSFLAGKTLNFPKFT